MGFVVELSPTAEADLERLFECLLDRCETTEDLDRAQAAIDAISATAQHRLAVIPFSFRKAAQNPGERELIIPFDGNPCAESARDFYQTPAELVDRTHRFKRFSRQSPHGPLLRWIGGPMTLHDRACGYGIAIARREMD